MLLLRSINGKVVPVLIMMLSGRRRGVAPLNLTFALVEDAWSASSAG